METENKIQTITLVAEEATRINSIEQSIQQAYNEAVVLSLEAKQNARAAIMRMADCGDMIIIGREQVKTNKREWISSIGIPIDKIEKLISLSRNRHQLELELWPPDVAKLGAQAIGILPQYSLANKQEGDSERTTLPSNNWLTLTGKLNNSLTELFISKPLSDWRDDEKQNVKVALKAIVDIYENL
jgi:hypothetical protein